MQVVEDNKILCSKECASRKSSEADDKICLLDKYDALKKSISVKELLWENKELELETKLGELLQELNKLSKENDEKSIYIKRQQRMSLDFGEDACNTEKILLQKTNDQKTTISELNIQISTLKEINSELQEKMGKAIPNWIQQQSDLAELNAMQINMLTSIETLTAENKLYSAELEQQKK
ncbi:hypothetical protein JTB14_030068 [Gonioctena quinquepunctata]|nr:hypothetical protein JTB14_030068 [Gonioctena quinquepunctata]